MSPQWRPVYKADRKKMMKKKVEYDSSKKSRKRKADKIQKDNRYSEYGEPINLNVEVKNKKMKKKKEGEGEEEELISVSRFRISDPLREKLKEDWIEALFPIQAKTFDLILDGSDLVVVCARTCRREKTLAFVLPILESLVNGLGKSSSKDGCRRMPSVIVLVPTTLLALSVHGYFHDYGGPMGLMSCCLVQDPYLSEKDELERGVDIVIGTPDGIKVHIKEGNLDMSTIKIRVLDRADNLGDCAVDRDAVELILGKVNNVTKVQTLIFSATLPSWVEEISSRFLNSSKKTIRLVRNGKTKSTANVKHFVMPCPKSAAPQLIPDIIRCYSSGGRTIIFCKSEKFADRLARMLPGAWALHDGIQQSTRDVTLSAFSSGKFMTLVATNDAGRGLVAMNDVQLIIQCEPPRDVKAYKHHSGRTGRAGITGVGVILYNPAKHKIFKIRKAGVVFERVSAPKPADIAKAVGVPVAESIARMSDSVVPVFKYMAEDLLKSSNLPAVEVLAKALAKAAGYTDMKRRSLLNSLENHVTLLVGVAPLFSIADAECKMLRCLPREKVKSIKGLTLAIVPGRRDHHVNVPKGAVFDVATQDVDLFLAAAKEDPMTLHMAVVDSLPTLQGERRVWTTFSHRFWRKRSSPYGIDSLTALFRERDLRRMAA